MHVYVGEKRAAMSVEDKLRSITEVTDIQTRPGNVTDDYMRGLANGLILAHSIMHEHEPIYLPDPKKAEHAAVQESVNEATAS